MMTEQQQAKLDKLTTFMVSKGVPEIQAGALARYYLLGTWPGQYLEALLKKDLDGIMAFGDTTTLAGLKATYMFIYHHLPSRCYGSAEAVLDWPDVVAKEGFDTAFDGAIFNK